MLKDFFADWFKTKDAYPCVSGLRRRAAFFCFADSRSTQGMGGGGTAVGWGGSNDGDTDERSCGAIEWIEAPTGRASKRIRERWRDAGRSRAG